jgi:hypothetical protein
MDQHGNVVAVEGCTRCDCGVKYWENDHCVSCGTHVRKSGLNADAIVASLPPFYRWANEVETENWTNFYDSMVQVVRGGTSDEPWTDLAIKEN